MELIANIAKIAGYLTGIAAAVLLVVKQFREFNDIKSGQRCSLRSDMLHTYYKNKDAKKIRQYELENFFLLYKAYKALGGNSFIDKIYQEVQTWEVIA